MYLYLRGRIAYTTGTTVFVERTHWRHHRDPLYSVSQVLRYAIAYPGNLDFERRVLVEVPDDHPDAEALRLVYGSRRLLFDAQPADVEWHALSDDAGAVVAATRETQEDLAPA